ncbi:hypothetical protein GCM10009530_23740 [Microbispora corallina]|uniref:Hemerythrin-like domain-containing protein n=1 Tax=Microbispora corallina TaxID=83302 RepID=A0ABQ4G7Q7_9ACTN|nr:hemerythrin domain-containing protein [Microbispora corallina]GIH43023.1 hypothetical protein Mco01_60230 [Microbispora corallina]
MSSTPVRLADSRDMYVAHRVFRREFAAAPDLVRRVEPGDVSRARLIADHVAKLTHELDRHHQGEDRLVWPKLLERAPTEILPIVETMERQHKVLHDALVQVDTALDRWRPRADAGDRDALAAALDAMLPPLGEHLDTEERHVLPLIDTYITEAEWAQVAEEAVKDQPKKALLVNLGMALYDADPAHLEVVKGAMPPPVWFVVTRLGPRAYARYARRIHGTPTPARFDEDRSRR